MNVPLSTALPLLALLILAARADLSTRRIPNRLVLVGLILAVTTRFAFEGSNGAISALLGALLAGGLLFPGWLLGWTGAGDVKLMAVAGAWLGAMLGAYAVLFSLIAGGVLALAYAIRHGALRRSIEGAMALGMWTLARATGPGVPAVTTGLRFPFAVAIATGTLVALWVRV